MIDMDKLSQILVFKTNVKTQEDKQRVKIRLDASVHVEEWSVDCEDIDCVLRVVSSQSNAEAIIKLINSLGYDCLELE